MKPTFGWVHESREQMEAVRKFIRSLEEGALDLLKFGQINDRYADIFFPGISTIMTRARYYIFVASAAISIEEGERWGKDANEEMKRLENIVRVKLMANDETTGIIGLLAKEELHSYPSDIYWGGLRTLGIFKGRDSKYQYFRRLKSLYLLRAETKSIVEEDEELSRHFTWDPRFITESMVDIEDEKKLSFKLSKSESQYLKTKFNDYSEDYEPSLISWLIREDTVVPASDDWNIIAQYAKKSRTISTRLQKHIEVAAQFRLLAGGLEQLYYVIICRRKWGTQSDLTNTAMKYLTERVEDETFRRAINQHETWLYEATGNDHFFSAAVEELIKTGISTQRIAESPILERLIEERERLKGKKARLTNKDAFDMWSTDDPRGGMPEYRLRVGMRMVRDIREGLYARA